MESGSPRSIEEVELTPEVQAKLAVLQWFFDNKETKRIEEGRSEADECCLLDDLRYALIMQNPKLIEEVFKRLNRLFSNLMKTAIMDIGGDFAYFLLLEVENSDDESAKISREQGDFPENVIPFPKRFEEGDRENIGNVLKTKVEQTAVGAKYPDEVVLAMEQMTSEIKELRESQEAPWIWRINAKKVFYAWLALIVIAAAGSALNKFLDDDSESGQKKTKLADANTSKKSKAEQKWGKYVEATRQKFRGDQVPIDFEAQEAEYAATIAKEDQEIAQAKAEGKLDPGFDPEKSWAAIAAEAERYREQQKVAAAREIEAAIKQERADAEEARNIIIRASFREARAKIEEKLIILTKEIFRLKRENEKLDALLEKHRAELAESEKSLSESEKDLAESEKDLAESRQRIIALMKKIENIAFKQQQNNALIKEKTDIGDEITREYKKRVDQKNQAFT